MQETQGSIPGVGKIPWRREWHPTPVFLPGESQGQRSLVGYNPWGHRVSDRTEWLTLSPTGGTCPKQSNRAAVKPQPARRMLGNKHNLFLLLCGFPAGSFHWSSLPEARGQGSWLIHSSEINILGAEQNTEGERVDLERGPETSTTLSILNLTIVFKQKDLALKPQQTKEIIPSEESKSQQTNKAH